MDPCWPSSRITESLVSTGPPVSLVLPAVTLNFGVVRAGSTVQYVTPGQDLTMSQTGGSGTVDWIALRDVPWLSTSPTFGTGPGLITFSVNSSAASLVSGTYIGHIWIYTDGTVDPALVPVRLTVTSAGTARAPVGVVDTPINGLSGVAGSMAVTGWAIDDVGVKQVRILRAPATGRGQSPSSSALPISWMAPGLTSRHSIPRARSTREPDGAS